MDRLERAALDIFVNKMITMARLRDKRMAHRSRVEHCTEGSSGCQSCLWFRYLPNDIGGQMFGFANALQ